MEITSINKSNLNFNHIEGIPASSIQRQYESSMQCNSCSSSCCIADFFKKIGEIFAYPFIKLYELITGCFRKKSDQVKNPEETAEKDPTESFPSLSTSYEDLEYLEPDRFNPEFFYQCALKGIETYERVYDSIPDQPGKHAASHALGWDQSCVNAWNSGISFFRGKNDMPFPAEWKNITLYEKAYAEGKAAKEILELTIH